MNRLARIFVIVLGLMLVLSVVVYAAETAPGTVILKGAPMGGVKFDHKAHAALTKCDTCHHASKPERPLKSEHENCQDCHTTPAPAGMTMKPQAAFHNPTATAGLCIDCHKAENAKGKHAPTKCTECHKKDNA